MDVAVDGAYKGTAVLDKVCRTPIRKVATLPSPHLMHEVTGLDPKRSHDITLFKRVGPKGGGVAFRGVIMPPGGSLVDLPTSPPATGPKGLIAIGASITLGHGVLCTGPGNDILRSAN